MNYHAGFRKSAVILACWAVLAGLTVVRAADEVEAMANVEEVISRAEARVSASRAGKAPAAPEVEVSKSAAVPAVRPAAVRPAAPAAVKTRATPGKGAEPVAAVGGPEVSQEAVVQLLRVQLLKKDHELAAANQEIARLKNIVRQIQEASRRENIIFHYNKAAVYRSSLMYKKAEEEYLAALALDPDDAAVHYNLAILYDDNFKDRKKAGVHYARFLELAPDDADAPKVREWMASIVL